MRMFVSSVLLSLLSCTPSFVISDIEITQAEFGPGLTSIIFKINNTTHNDNIYDLCDAELKFLPPFEELNYNSIKCYKISNNEFHFTTRSTLWVDISKEEFAKKVANLKNNNTYIILNYNEEEWRLGYKSK